MELLEAVKIDKKSGYFPENISELYEATFPIVAKFISDMGGSFDDARDIFHDALVIYHEGASKHVTRINTSQKAYILGIVRHLWIRRLSKSKNFVHINDLDKAISIPDDYFSSVNNNRLLIFLEQTGKKCLELLRAFYYQGLPLKKLADQLGYSNEHSVSVQKFKCLEKVRNTIKEKSLAYEDFIE